MNYGKEIENINNNSHMGVESNDYWVRNFALFYIDFACQIGPLGALNMLCLSPPGGSCIQMIVQNSEGARVYSSDLRGAYSK